MLQHVDGIMANQPKIRNPGRLRLQQAMTHTGFMNLDADEIHRGICSSLFDESLPVAKPYLEDSGSGTAEDRLEIDEFIGEMNSEDGPELL